MPRSDISLQGEATQVASRQNWQGGIARVGWKRRPNRVELPSPSHRLQSPPGGPMYPNVARLISGHTGLSHVKGMLSFAGTSGAIPLLDILDDNLRILGNAHVNLKATNTVDLLKGDSCMRSPFTYRSARQSAGANPVSRGPLRGEVAAPCSLISKARLLIFRGTSTMSQCTLTRSSRRTDIQICGSPLTEQAPGTLSTSARILSA